MSDKNDVTRLSAAELADKLSAGEISSREVTQAHLNRIHEVESEVHAFLHVADDIALQAADAVDAQRSAGAQLSPLAAAA